MASSKRRKSYSNSTLSSSKGDDIVCAIVKKDRSGAVDATEFLVDSVTQAQPAGFGDGGDVRDCDGGRREF